VNARTQRIVLLVTDLVTISLAWIAYYHVRVRTGWLDVPIEPDFLAPMAFVYLFWALLFFLVGLYRPFYAASRFDELALLFKTISFGCLFLFFVIFFDDAASAASVSSRLLIVIYWAILLATVGTGRLLLRSLQRRLLINGIGVHKTMIRDEVAKYPALGLRVAGFVRLEQQWSGPAADPTPVLGGLDDLATIIPGHDIRETLIAVDAADHERLLQIVTRCSAFNIGVKIVPDLYEIISGLAKTNAIYGFPLIDVSPQLMKPWEEGAKRLIDLAVAGLVLIAGLPVWLLIALAIKIDSRGPVLYRQERVGMDGKHFRIIKFRSMVADAEKAGPQWALKIDPRITTIGRSLRKLHLDEIPQVWNVLRGEMSLVGPRPERPVFVEELIREIPLYPRRLRVRPGVTGWAQVKHKYDESIEDVRKKVQYDLYYIENMSLRMDMKIIFSTVSHMLMGKGH
jgi:exopolysaccharide biosynthesis polyprenyl glycosylphosphotransferase